VHEISRVFGFGMASEVALRTDHGEVNGGREPHLDHVLVNRGSRANARIEALFPMSTWRSSTSTSTRTSGWRRAYSAISDGSPTRQAMRGPIPTSLSEASRLPLANTEIDFDRGAGTNDAPRCLATASICFSCSFRYRSARSAPARRADGSPAPNMKLIIQIRCIDEEPQQRERRRRIEACFGAAGALGTGPRTSSLYPETAGRTASSSS